MAPLPRTSEGKVRLSHPDTGHAVTVWPVDARILIESCGYTVDPPTENASPRGEASATSVSATPTESAPILSADLVPHVTQASATEGAVSPTGAPLVVATSGTVAPMQPPVRSTPKKK